MSNVALTAAGLLLTTGLAAGQYLPPYLDASDKQEAPAAKPPSFIAPAPSPATDQPTFYPPMPPSAEGVQPDRPAPFVPARSGWILQKDSQTSLYDENNKSSPTSFHPQVNLPLLDNELAPPIRSTSAFKPMPAGYRFWFGSEALLWWEKNERLPANLVTTGLATDAMPGALGQPNTLGLSGSNNVNFGPFAGVRLFAGTWLDPQQILGVEASGFVLEQNGQGQNFNSTVGGNPLLALRYLNALTGIQNAFVIATPSMNSGGIAVQTSSQLWGADANLLHSFFWTPCFRLVGLFGFRYLDLSEGLSIQTRTMALGGSRESFLGQNFAAPAYELTADRFHARSQFFGGQIGLRGEYYFSHFFVAAIGKLAVGQTDEVINTLGVSTLQIGATQIERTAGGLYALPSNSGHFVNPDFGIVPELQLKAGVLLTRWLRATIGYDVLYWSRVMRVGDVLDLTVDPRQTPTSLSYQTGIAAHSPQPAFNTQSFWVQGLTFGLEFTF